MKRHLIMALGAGLLLAPISMAHAGVLERACLRADRPAANQSLCGCIQQVADLTLTRRDQRMAAKFFQDPHRAQEVRQSDRKSHEVFWKKWRNFGQSAENYCN